jgi:hypothetical protein
MRATAARTAAVAVAGAVGILLLISSCAATRPEKPRTTPTASERAAARTAQSAAVRDGIPINREAWVQLWTPVGAGKEIDSCVSGDSNGALGYIADPALAATTGFAYQITVNETGALIDFSTMQRIVDGCIATAPVDDRILHVPRREWPALYSYDVTFLRRCLLAHGQSPESAPSRSEFGELLASGASWSPYDAVAVRNRAAWYSLADACPAFPPEITFG